MEHEAGNIFTVEDKIMDIWKGYFGTLSEEDDIVTDDMEQQGKETTQEKIMGRQSNRKI